MVTNSGGVQFSSEVLERFLSKVYGGFDVSSDIEPTAWREVLRIMNEASVEGLLASDHTTHELSFLSKIKHSNEVFSAFKVHSMGVKMQERLYDERGQLRSFEDWKKSVQDIASHQVGSWLRTEYDTAILRAHQAADWQEFERNRDIFPNLRWMPTTSPVPDTIHEGFWATGLTLPINDPFWATNHPANRWNCKCSLEATDEPASGGNWGAEGKPSTAQQGLEENPRHGHTFSDKHPYFPQKCSSCAFYTQGGRTLKNLLSKVVNSRKKDCYSCPYVNAKIGTAKYAENYAEYLRLKEDSDYKEVEFDTESGGVKAIHQGHKRNSTKDRYFGKENLKASDLEDECVDILFKAGNTVLLQNETKKGADGNTLSALDLSINRVEMDIRSITENKDNYKNALTSKNKQLYKYNSRADVTDKADSVCLYFHDPSMIDEEKIKATIQSYRELTQEGSILGEKYGQQIKNIYIVINDGDVGRVLTYEV